MRDLVIFTAAVTLIATTLFAHQGVKNPGVMQRMHAMKSAQDSLNVLTDMAKGKQAFDASQAETARNSIMQSAMKTISLFEEPHSDPKSEALPIIWDQFDGFTQKATASLHAAKVLDVSTLARLRATLPSLGQSCLDCHTDFRKKK